MKFNWGTGIFLFYGLFAAALFFVVYRSTQYDRSLVYKDYYAKDLAYQEHYDKVKNSLSLDEKLQISYDAQDKQVSLRFPEGKEVASGKIHFFHPVNSKWDFEVEVKAGKQGLQKVPVEAVPPGRWRVRVDWEANDKKYFDEEEIYI